MENFQIVWIFSGLSGNFPDHPENIQPIRKLSKGSGNFPVQFQGLRAKTFRVAMPPCHPGFCASGHKIPVLNIAKSIETLKFVEFLKPSNKYQNLGQSSVWSCLVNGEKYMYKNFDKPMPKFKEIHNFNTFILPTLKSIRRYLGLVFNKQANTKQKHSISIATALHQHNNLTETA